MAAALASWMNNVPRRAPFSSFSSSSSIRGPWSLARRHRDTTKASSSSQTSLFRSRVSGASGTALNGLELSTRGTWCTAQILMRSKYIHWRAELEDNFIDEKKGLADFFRRKIVERYTCARFEAWILYFRARWFLKDFFTSRSGWESEGTFFVRKRYKCNRLPDLKTEVSSLQRTTEKLSYDFFPPKLQQLKARQFFIQVHTTALSNLWLIFDR